LTALALAPAGAHLFALPNKIGLAEEAYFIAQGTYRGWALLGIVLIGALLADAALAFVARQQPIPFRLAITGLVLIAATLAIFLGWIYPANQSTENWTAVPGNWEQLRSQWEYGHAVNAILTFAGLCAVTGSVLFTRDQ